MAVGRFSNIQEELMNSDQSGIAAEAKAFDRIVAERLEHGFIGEKT